MREFTNRRYYWIYIVITLIGIMIYMVMTKEGVSKTNKINYRIGSAEYCKRNPDFIAALNIPEPIYIDMTQKKGKGLVMISGGKNGTPLQLPSWDDAGYLGPYTLDEKGNIYVAPVPFVSVDEYLPENQNIIYKVNSLTGKMNEFIKLPWAKQPHHNNPYNILGLAYDCDTKSLYASTVAGSTFDEEVGRIYQIDIKHKKIVDQKNNIDAIGLGVYNFKKRKVLYLGLARSPVIHSIFLDRNGHFSNKVKYEISLNELPGGGFDKCHRIRFLRNNTMELKGIDFNYTLHAESDVQRNIYNFKYNNDLGNWEFIEVHKQF